MKSLFKPLLAFMIGCWAALQPILSAESFSPVFSNPLTEAWRWTRQIELSGKGITCLTETPDGVMWFGGDAAVYSYDGREWKSWSAQEGIAGAVVNTIKGASDNSLWVQTSLAILHYKDGAWTRLPIPPSFMPASGCIQELPDGTILCASTKGILHIMGPSSIVLYSNSGTFPINNQEELEFASASRQFLIGDFCPINADEWLVMVNRSDVYRWNYALALSGKTETWTKVDVLSNYIKIVAGFLTSEPQQGIWLFTADAGHHLLNYDPATDTFKEFKPSETGGSASHQSVIRTSTGDLIVGATGSILVHSQGKWTTVNDKEMNIKSGALSVFESSKGVLWVCAKGTDTYCVDYFGKNYTSYENLCFEAESKDGTLWFMSHDDRIVSHNPHRNHWTSYSQTDGLPQRICALVAASDGSIWVGGQTGISTVVSRLKPGQQTWTSFEYPEFGLNVSRFGMAEHPDGSIWISASTINHPGSKTDLLGGLLRIDPASGHARAYCRGNDNVQSSGIPITQVKINQMVMRIGYVAIDANGIPWMGAFRVGYINNDSSAIFLTEPASLAMQGCNDLLFDSDNRVWIAKPGLGAFSSIDRINWQRHSVENGLPSNTIVSMAVASDNSIWSAGDEGISRFDHTTWITYALPPSLKINMSEGDIRTSSDGSIWVNQYSMGWVLRAPVQKNREAFRGQLKSVRYQPSTEAPMTSAFTSRSTYGHDSQVIVEWSAKDAWNITPENQIQFSYRINDGPWSPFSYERRYVFESLKAGDYRIAVRARDSDFNVDPYPAEVRFRVNLPLWFQWWFILIALIIISSITWLSIRILHFTRETAEANRKMAAVNDNLSSQSTQLTSAYGRMNASVVELAGGVNQVAGMSTSIADSSIEIKQNSELISQGSIDQSNALRSIAESIQRLTDASNRTTESARDVHQRMETTSSLTQEGSQNMSKLATAMEGIRSTANQTQQIIASIEEIAQQTNLLSLNASIESARAGMHGSRFGVIAEEIGVLAKKSSQAAKTTEMLLHESMIRAEEGVTRNKAMIDQLEQIRKNVLEVGRIVIVISDSANEQNRWLVEISHHIETSNHITQKNAGASQSMLFSAESMAELSESFQQLVVSFKQQLDELAASARQ